MKKVKVGVIGLGMGRGHLRQYHQHPKVEVAAICDLNPELLNRLSKEYHVPGVYSDYRKMLKEVPLDAVSIATPNKWHAPMTHAALDAGLHVLCEKPMAMTVKEAEGMKAKAEKRKRNLMIHFNQRFTPIAFAMKAAVEKGIIGDIYFGRTFWHRQRGMPGFGGWFGQKAMSGGGPLIDLGVHRLDLAMWLMGYPEPAAVTGSAYNKIAGPIAKAQRKPFDVEDLACGLIKFHGGATLFLEASWALNMPSKESQRTELFGTQGSLVNRVEYGEPLIGEILTEKKGKFSIKPINPGKKKVPAAPYEFIASILEGRVPLASADQGVKVMKVLEGLYKSAVTGKEVRYDRKK